jgi:elongation factor Ts
MTEIKAQDVMRLREKTGFPMMECKRALEEAGGEEEKALEILKKHGLLKATQKKAERTVKSGLIESYSHDGKIGVLVELSSETDFVAKNEEFKKLAHDIALQVAAMAPTDVADLLNQPFIRDQEKTVDDLVNELIAKVGEKIVVSRFVRFELGVANN